MAILEIDKLVVHYGKINALKGVSLSINAGDIVTIIGANGAGKTTLLQAISGVIKCTSGSVKFNGKNITNERSDKILQHGVAHVPEGRRVFSELTVEENLLCGAYLNNDKAEKKRLIDEQYEIFPRLAERKKQEAGSLSGGEQQMLAIARGMMSKPAIVLLDEPSLGLAPILVERIFDMIAEINKMGKTILLVEQNANIALHVASYGYILETGKITVENTTEVLRSDDTVKKAYLGMSAPECEDINE
ncbi:MAG: ABC transporter ATP-binding protein [Spirochaetales bacterium]|nr:ABC transporter ATP-binding protein [Spirochaetales bacterium]